MICCMLNQGSLLAVLIVALLAAPQSTPPAADEAAVRDLVSQYANGREKGDPAAVAALFTADADQLVSSGEWRRGRDVLVKGVLSSTQAGGKRTTTVETVRFLTPDTAIVDARYEIVGGAYVERRMWSSFVMARTKSGWRIAAIRNMLPAPPSQ
jgi:uncharacterized protein (TIGR02246 family)